MLYSPTWNRSGSTHSPYCFCILFHWQIYHCKDLLYFIKVQWLWTVFKDVPSQSHKTDKSKAILDNEMWELYEMHEQLSPKVNWNSSWIYCAHHFCLLGGYHETTLSIFKNDSPFCLSYYQHDLRISGVYNLNNHWLQDFPPLTQIQTIWKTNAADITDMVSILG